MRILVVLAHPGPGSFNHAIAHRVVEILQTAGHQCVLQDLYAEGFDPLLAAGEATRGASPPQQIAAACDQLDEADGIIVVHPNWWGMPPAILVGWIDRVVRVDRAYRFLPGDAGEGTPVGLLKARSAVVLNTSDTYPQREREVFGDPLERIWRDCVFGLCGVQDVHRRTFSVVVTSSREDREAWLDEAAELVSAVFPAGAPYGPTAGPPRLTSIAGET